MKRFTPKLFVTVTEKHWIQIQVTNSNFQIQVTNVYILNIFTSYNWSGYASGNEVEQFPQTLRLISPSRTISLPQLHQEMGQGVACVNSDACSVKLLVVSWRALLRSSLRRSQSLAGKCALIKILAARGRIHGGGPGYITYLLSRD